MSEKRMGIGQVQMVPITQVYPSQDNPRRITDRAVDMVAHSISRFGWQQAIVVDSAREVIAGHTRLLAAQKLGLKLVPVIVADKLSPQEVRAYRIADNRTADFTSWDFPELTVQLEELSEEFSDVLGLTNWQSIVTTYNEKTSPVLQFDEEVIQESRDYIDSKFQITVIFKDKESARKASAKIIDMDGVMDIRDKR